MRTRGPRGLARAVAGLAVIVLAFTGCETTAGAIKIPTGELAARFTSRPPQNLQAWISKPDGPGPFPAIILLHGCVGPGGDTGSVLSSHSAHFHRRGWVTLILDSFTTRGVNSNCFAGAAEPRPPARAVDAYTALAHLAAQPYVDSKRVVIQGLSQGGTTVLRVFDDRFYGDDGIARPSVGALRFAAGVAYYPECLNAATLRFYGPVLVLIGDSDEWTPAAQCEGMHPYSASERRGIHLVRYPGVHHAFDFPFGFYLTTFGAVQGNLAATRDAVERADRFIEEHLRAR